MIRYSMVCTRCSRGWESNHPTGVCHVCHERAILRGSYRVRQGDNTVWVQM